MSDKETFKSWVFEINFGDGSKCKEVMPYMKLAWNHQQQKIDKLEKENEELRKNVFDQVCLERDYAEYLERSHREDNKKLEQQLKEANEIINDFYDYLDIENESVSDTEFEYVCKIREYKKKYKTN